MHVHNTTIPYYSPLPNICFVKYLMDKKRWRTQRKSCTKARIKGAKVEGTRAETERRMQIIERRKVGNKTR